MSEMDALRQIIAIQGQMIEELKAKAGDIILTSKQAAKHMGISTKTLHRYSREIGFVQRGRNKYFKLKNITQWQTLNSKQC